LRSTCVSDLCRTGKCGRIRAYDYPRLKKPFEAASLVWFFRWCNRPHVSRLFRDMGLAINTTLGNESHATRSVGRCTQRHVGAKSSLTRVVSMGRRNTKLEVYLQESQKAKIVPER